MSDFSNKIVVCHTYVKTIETCVEKLQYLRDNINSFVGTEKERQLSQDLEGINKLVFENQQKMQVMLDLLQKSLEEAKNEDRVLLVIFNNSGK